MLDVELLRKDYPILDRKVYGKPWVYLDNAATALTPRCVVEAVDSMYYHTKSNVHRGVHRVSQEATELQEATRERVRGFINAASTREVIFTRGTPRPLTWWHHGWAIRLLMVTRSYSLSWSIMPT